jgi:large repetitive protein
MGKPATGSKMLPLAGTLRRVSAAGGVAIGVTAILATTAFAAETPIVIESFTNATTTSSAWVLPMAPTGTNVACLTASSNSSQTPIPGCALSTPDPAGAGALRLTDATGSEEGGVAFTQTLPTTKGLDVSFNSYQYGGSQADGIGFFLAATNPASPTPPSTIGSPGGDLGYSSGTGTTGLADGYLGVGLDVYGNFTNGDFDGTGCTDPSWVGASAVVPGQVTVRGPGNGTTGYCPLTSTAATDSGAPQALDGGPSGSRAGSKVPVEIAINPSTSSLTTTSGLVVPPGDYAVAFTPIGGAKESFDGVLPTAGNGEIPSGTIPTAWINSKTGLPYQLTMGWIGSTGGATDIHEITDAAADTLSGKLPGLAASLSVQPAQTNAIATYVLHVSTTASGGPETQSILVTDTFPSSVTPHASGAGGTGWVCSVSGQKDTCTYAVSAALAPGTILPPLSMPVTVDAPGGTTINDAAAVSSNDVFPVSVSAAFVVPGISVPMTGAAQSPLASPLAGLILILAGGVLAGAEVGFGIRRSLRRRSAL